MNSYEKRINLKGFGILVDDNFYIGKEQLFPFNRFYGYHAGVDLEIFPVEETVRVPVYAVSTGEVIYVGSLPGYGGVILQDLEGENHTALYGHIKIEGIKVGEKIIAGEILTYLGDVFSKETSKERKHLHLAIYKGKDLYFKGHEATQVQLNARWENPTSFLNSKRAILPQGGKSPKNHLVPPSPQNAIVKKDTGFFQSLFQIFKILLGKIKIS